MIGGTSSLAAPQRNEIAFRQCSFADSVYSSSSVWSVSNWMICCTDKRKMSNGVQSVWLIRAFARKGGRITKGVCLKMVLLFDVAEEENRSSADLMDCRLFGVGVQNDIGVVSEDWSKMIGFANFSKPSSAEMVVLGWRRVPPIFAGLWRSFICLVMGATKRMIMSGSSVRFCMMESLVVVSEMEVAVESDDRTLLLLSLEGRVWK